MSRDAQERAFQEERRTGLGGSDVGVILGLDPYRTPFELWQEKTGRSASFEGNLATRFGKHGEQFVAEEYGLRTGRKVQRYNTVLRHREAPLIGHPDRLVVPEGQKTAAWRREIRTDLGLEAKTANAFAVRYGDWGEEGTDQVPAHYLLQCQAYMTLTGCPRWDLAVLIGGNADFRIYHLHHDAELEGVILEEAARWWREHVISDRPPPPQTETEARQRWASHQPGKVAELDGDSEALLREYAGLKGTLKRLNDRETALRDQLIPAFADAEQIIARDGSPLATYKANKPSARTDWKAVAIAAGADDALIERHTDTKEGARVLRLAKTLMQENE
jgi:putative phage-type endonuclease